MVDIWFGPGYISRLGLSIVSLAPTALISCETITSVISVGRNGGSIRAEYTIKWGAIALIFLLTGLSLSTRAFLNQALNWHLHIVTQVNSFFVFSAVVYGVVWAIVASGNTHLDRVVLGGIITMGVLPTTL